MDKKVLRNDIILISSLLLVIAVSLIVLHFNKKTSNLVAKIMVQDSVVETIDLSKNEEHDYYVDGLKGTLHIHTKDGGIAVLSSNCPHQDCVRMGYINTSGRPIICAYNAVTISIDGGSQNDVGIG